MEAPKGVSISSCSSKKTVLSTSWMSKISNMGIRMSIGFADSSRIYAVLAPHTWIISVPAAPPYHLLSFALALHCLWAVTPNSTQEASYGYGLGNERLWIRAGMLSACSSRIMYFMNWDLVLFAHVCLRNLCYVSGALMSAAGVQALAAGVSDQLPAYNSIFPSVTWGERKKPTFLTVCGIKTERVPGYKAI